MYAHAQNMYAHAHINNYINAHTRAIAFTCIWIIQ